MHQKQNLNYDFFPLRNIIEMRNKNDSLVKSTVPMRTKFQYAGKSKSV